MNGFNFEWVEKKSVPCDGDKEFPVNISISIHQKDKVKEELIRINFEADTFKFRFKNARSIRVGFALGGTIMGFFPEDDLSGYAASKKSVNYVTVLVPVARLPKEINPYRICNNYKLYVDDSGIPYIKLDAK